MKLSELKKANISEGLYVVEGDDAYLRSKAVGIFRSLVDNDVADLNVSELTSDVSSGALTSAIEALPFMADRRVVIVRDWTADEGDKAVKSVLNAVKGSSTVLVLVSDTVAVPAALKKAAVIVKCDKPGDYELADAIAQRFLSASVRISPATCRMIATFCGMDTGRAFNEVDKLISAGLDEVTDSDVRQYVHRETDYAVFALTDAIAAGNKAHALEVLRDLSVGNSPSSILSVLYTNYRRVLYVALSKADDETLVEALGVHPYVLKKLRAQARAYTQVRLKALVDKLNELETDFKTGKLSEANAMWLAIFNIFES